MNRWVVWMVIWKSVWVKIFRWKDGGGVGRWINIYIYIYIYIMNGWMFSLMYIHSKLIDNIMKRMEVGGNGRILLFKEATAFGLNKIITSVCAQITCYR